MIQTGEATMLTTHAVPSYNTHAESEYQTLFTGRNALSTATMVVFLWEETGEPLHPGLHPLSALGMIQT